MTGSGFGPQQGERGACLIAVFRVHESAGTWPGFAITIHRPLMQRSEHGLGAKSDVSTLEMTRR